MIISAKGACEFPPAPEDQMTRDNWNRAPFSKRAFVHMRRIFRSEQIKTLPLQSGFDSQLTDFSSLILDYSGKKTPFLEFLKDTHTDGFIVWHKGAIKYLYTDDYDPNAPHMAFSITKSVIGLIAQMMIEEGKIDDHCVITDLIPELKASGFKDATFRHVLDMRDGVIFDETYSQNPNADIHRYSRAYFGPKLGETVVRGPLGGGVYDELVKLQAGTHRPGDQFSYRTPVGDVVGWCVQRASGRRLSDVIGEYVFTPMGAQDQAYLLVDQGGQDMAGTGLNLSLFDLVRFGIMLTNPPTQHMRQAVAKILHQAKPVPNNTYPTRLGYGYGSLWWVGKEAPESLRAIGVFGQRLCVWPQKELVIARFGSHPAADNSPTDAAHHAAFQAIIDAL